MKTTSLEAVHWATTLRRAEGGDAEGHFEKRERKEHNTGRKEGGYKNHG